MQTPSFIKKGYVVAALIGKGSTAEVYRIKDNISGKYFACKISGQKARLARESELLKRISHPLFPKWHEYVQEEGYACLIMEDIRGGNLHDFLTRRKHLTVKEALYVTLELADGLNFLHELQPAILYRDLKPANIMLRQDGKVKLIDLGTAGAERRERAGTPGFSAPEIFLGERQDFTCDIYSLGKVLEAMLIGSEIPTGLMHIIRAAISERQEERIPGMRELIRHLAVYQDMGKAQIWFHETRNAKSRVYREHYLYEKDIWLKPVADYNTPR